MKIKRNFTILCVKCSHRFHWEIVEKEEDWDPEKTGETIVALPCPRCGGKTDLQSVDIKRM